MSKRKYEWEYGENDYQIYFDTCVGKDHLRVFANKAYPDTWMGCTKQINVLWLSWIKHLQSGKKRKAPLLQKLY